MRGRWRSKVLVRESILPAVVRLVVLWWGRALRLRLGLWGRRAVVGTAGCGGRVGIAWWRRRSSSWCVRRVRRYVQVAVLGSLLVILLPLRWITQNLMGSLDLLELDDKLLLTPWISVGVVLQSKRAEGFADLVLAGVGSDL